MISKKNRRRLATTLLMMSTMVSAYAVETLAEPEMATPAKALVTDAAKTVVAKVNGVEISGVELDREVVRAKSAMPPTATEDQLKEAALNQLIDRQLLSQYAVAEKIEVPTAEVEERLKSIKANFPSNEEMLNALAQDGLTLETLTAAIQEALQIQKMIDTKVAPEVKVAEESVKKFYDENPNYFVTPEQIHARHILMKLGDSSTDEEKTQARATLAEVKKLLGEGKSFEELAKQYSQGPSAPMGGDLGFFGKGQMVPAFEAAAYALKVGEVSELVETQFGYHLINLVEKKEGGTQAFAEVSEKIKAFLSRGAIGEAVEGLLKELKAKAKIELI